MSAMADDPFERAAKREWMSRVRHGAGLRSRDGTDEYDGGGFLLVPVAAWTLMILAGVVHHEFDLGRPIGYWPLFAIVAGFYVLVAILRSWLRR